MNRREISDTITKSGIGGLEKEIKKQQRESFCSWGILYLCIIACVCIVLHRSNVETESNIQQFKYDYAVKVGTQYGIAMDSLVKISENNGIENCIIKK